ncbi:helix-turn-helix domain-containing protein [Agrobacterium tumefaciens]|uniref:helix-turn-helix domain-containing protein n=1 Tax=Agrobacterium tumefaciens TaxID=358 RepID=UPI0021D0022D|nr:helix-turn-helix domain-containing protein [Agrobacterium tumefaciens]UXS03483.1 helix-turn-helix domain-containing protein [Agrobacterium tumefaciens]
MRAAMGDRLYGEEPAPDSEFRFHCETLYSRSSLHRFEIGSHRHAGFLQILFISGGEGDAVFEGRVEPINPPVAIVVPPGFEHGFRFSRTIEGVIVTVLPGALSTSTQAVLRRNFASPKLMALKDIPELDLLQSAFQTISREYIAHEAGWDAMIEGQLAVVATWLARIARPISLERGDGVTEKRFDLLLSLIARHVREPRQAAFYAERLGLSQTHLNRLVRNACGLSLQRLVARRQLEVAKQELIFTASTVRMIGEGLGFADPAYFNRFFRRETGMSPQAWRLAEQQKMAVSAKALETNLTP